MRIAKIHRLPLPDLGHGEMPRIQYYRSVSAKSQQLLRRAQQTGLHLSSKTELGLLNGQYGFAYHQGWKLLDFDSSFEYPAQHTSMRRRHLS
jgi:hypothetical protein